MCSVYPLMAICICLDTLACSLKSCHLVVFMCLANTYNPAGFLWQFLLVTIVLGSSPACDITAVMYVYTNYLHFSKLTAVFNVGLTIKREGGRMLREERGR